MEWNGMEWNGMEWNGMEQMEPPAMESPLHRPTPAEGQHDNNNECHAPDRPNVIVNKHPTANTEAPEPPHGKRHEWKKEEGRKEEEEGRNGGTNGTIHRFQSLNLQLFQKPFVFPVADVPSFFL
jgi:hypothetical protein